MRPTCNAPDRHKARGFTLIELMVTIAVLAIISAIALPSFRLSSGLLNRLSAFAG